MILHHRLIKILRCHLFKLFQGWLFILSVMGDFHARIWHDRDVPRWVLLLFHALQLTLELSWKNHKTWQSTNWDCPQHHCGTSGTAHQPWKQFLTMAEKLPLPSPLIYHAPNHILLPRRRRSHAIITPYGRRQKNGENKLRLRDFTVLTLTIFSIKLLFPGPSCDPGYLSSQKDFCPASAVTRFCLLQ